MVVHLVIQNALANLGQQTCNQGWPRMVKVLANGIRPLWPKGLMLHIGPLMFIAYWPTILMYWPVLHRVLAKDMGVSADIV